MVPFLGNVLLREVVLIPQVIFENKGNNDKSIENGMEMEKEIKINLTST